MSIGSYNLSVRATIASVAHMSTKKAIAIGIPDLILKTVKHKVTKLTYCLKTHLGTITSNLVKIVVHSAKTTSRDLHKSQALKRKHWLRVEFSFSPSARAITHLMSTRSTEIISVIGAYP